MLEVELCHRFEQLAGEMLRGPTPAEPKVYFPGVARMNATSS